MEKRDGDIVRSKDVLNKETANLEQSEFRLVAVYRGRPEMSNLASKLDQISPKWDKYWTF